jgi:HlyB family type I secretion system ABC transporter
MNREMRDVLEKTTFVQLLPEDQREGLMSSFTEVRYGFGDEIIREGDEADAFYILASGRARVCKKSEGGEEVPLNVLHPGAEFGELGLLEGRARMATVRCSTDATALRLDREVFRRLLGDNPKLQSGMELLARHRTLHNFLREFSGFSKLPFPVLRGLLENLEPVTVPAGESIIRQGDGPGPLYILEQGRARVFAKKEGTSTNLAFLRPGDYFGELSVFVDAPRAATVEALTDCRLLQLTSEALRNLMAESPELKKLLEERIAGYHADREARIPLDFAQELLPAEASAHNKVQIDEEEEREPSEEEEEPFATPDGMFAGRRRRIRRIPYVSQVDEADCGAASLAMVCRHFGRRVSLSRIRELAHTAWDGTSLKGICSAAEALGLAARPYKVSHRSLERLPLPAIVHWEGNHWVVLTDARGTRVLVADPAVGLRRLPREEFLEKWSGYAALFEPTPAFASAPETHPSLAWTLPFFKASRGALLGCLGLALAATALQLAFPALTQLIVDRVVMAGAVRLLGTLVLALAAALLCMLGADVLQGWLLSIVSVRVDTGILDFLTRKLLALPMSYFSRRRTGDIQRRLAGAREVREFVVNSGIGGILSLLELAAYLGLMAFYSRKLLLVFLVTIPLYAGLMVFSRRVLRPLFASLEESYGRYSSQQIDAIKGIEAVKAAAAEEGFREKILGEFTSLAHKQRRGNFIGMLYGSTLRAVGLIGTILFLWLGARMVVSGELSIGSFVAFNALVAMSVGPVMAALGLWDELQSSAVLLDRLSDVFESEPEQGADHSGLKAVPSLEGRVELRGVGFQYGGPEAPHILRGISLDVPAGRSIAIVGRSGGGKTTLIKCLAGLLEPTEGTVLFDGVDMRSLDYQQLRRHIGVVLQQNYMFDGTILGNIAFGDPEPQRDRAVWAAKLANAHDFIRQLPLGYETRIGESGLMLSGGQQQRIGIARALYIDPPVLIFDEATSALDTESEHAIQENMARLLSGRTTFIIAHRLSTIRHADLIVVVEKGGIAERGTHDELMSRRGLYFYMSSQQIDV